MSYTIPTSVYIETVSCCNARCPWCDTGMRKNGTLPALSTPTKPFMDPQYFLTLLAHLRSSGMITQETVVYPYNYGEPFLHPKFELLLRALEGIRQPYGLSTNGSIVPKLTGETRLEHLQSVTFSMPGFSQKSYDAVHGFALNTIKRNITATLRRFRQAGFRGKAEIAFHEYTFNAHEKDDAAQFAFHNGMLIRSNTAIPLSLEIVSQYLTETLNPSIAEHMREYMDMDEFRQKLGTRKENFTCEPKKCLLISSTGQLLRCSWVAENLPANMLGNIMDMTAEDVANLLAEKHSFCTECINCEADYFMTGWPCRAIAAPPLIPGMSERKPFLTKDGTWLWLGDNEKVFGDLVKQDNYEPHTVKFINRYIKPGDVCIDVGANIGLFSAQFARMVSPSGRVYAFEPSPHFRTVLQHTLQHNGLENVTVFPYALSNRSGTAKLQENSITGGQCFPSAHKPLPQHEVTLRSLDSLADSLKLTRLDLIKIDVDGHEPYVLEGALQIIDTYNPIIVVEMSHLHYYLEGTTGWDFYHWLAHYSFHIYHEGGRKINNLLEFLSLCANFNQVCNLILTRVPLQERLNLRDSKNSSVAIHKSSACPICKAEWYGPGPNGRMHKDGSMPRCLYCESLERHRSLRLIWNALLPSLPNGSALQFSRDPSLPEEAFLPFEVSVYGGENSLDLQAIAKPDSSYEYVLCNHVLEHVADDITSFAELLRILTPSGVLQMSFPDPFRVSETVEYGHAVSELHGHYRLYGSDVWERFATHADFYLLQVNSIDPVTGLEDCCFFVAKTKEPIERIEHNLKGTFTTIKRAFIKSSEVHMQDCPLPPKELRFMGEDDAQFLEVGDVLIHMLEQALPLEKANGILDIGCGYGRLAHALLRNENFSGTYYGLDILPKHIQWCQQAISPGRNFFFHHMDVKNDRYNPSGKHHVDEVDLTACPQVDLASFFSVFTHMYEQDIRAYLRHVRPLLQSQGRLVCTAFLLNEGSRAGEAAGKSTFPMQYQHNEYTRYFNAEDPLHAIGYEESAFLNILRDEKFSPVQVTLGCWSGRPAGKTPHQFQDLIIAKPF